VLKKQRERNLSASFSHHRLTVFEEKCKFACKKGIKNPTSLKEIE
jgi:hypothetical protein